MKRFLLFPYLYGKKRGGKEGSASLDERELSEKCRHRKKFHFISVEHHHSPFFASLSSLSLQLPKTQSIATSQTVKEIHRKVCKDFFCQYTALSWDALHNGCQRSLEWDNGTSCCFAELLRNVCPWVCVCVCASVLFCIIVNCTGWQPAVSYGM